jgi:hypothetical protein
MPTCNGERERERERKRGTQVGVMMGAGAAKTGLFWMREGGDGEELSLANTQGRNVAFLTPVWAPEVDERHQPLIEAVDMAHNALVLGRFIHKYS